MRRPPLVLTFLFILLLALGTTGGAVMSMLRPEIQRYSAERIFAAPEVHSLSGSREYDTEVVGDLVFSVEAGLSFFHTHAEGMGVVLLFAATTVVSLVGRRRLRLALSWLFGLSFLFPIGYLAYSAFVLRYGKDSGIALAERALLIPFGSSAILGVGLLIGAVGFLFVNGRLRGRPSARGAPAVGEDSGGWRRPPRLVVLAAALLITLAEIGGASMARFKPEITSFVMARMLERPGVHGLVGVKDVDAEVLEEALVKLDGGLRLFHLHGEGMGLVIFWVGLVLSSVVAAWWLRTTLYALLTLGGFGFPFGYFLSSALIPFVGVGSARAISAALVLLPFGGMVLIALWVLTLLLGRDLVAAAWRLQGRARVGAFPSPGPLPLGERETSDPRPSGERVNGEGAADGAARSAMDLPPLPVILASLLILLLAEVGGGLMVKFKLSLDRANRERIEARSEVHRLVGVREVDGPVIDKLLSRADFALRLFHLHGEGMGLVIFAGGVMVRNFLDSRVLSGVLYAMLAGGGLLYPFGYLAWSGMIPLVGLDRSKDLAEHFVWVPFGGAALAAMGVISLLLGRDLYASWRGKGG